MSKIIEMNVVQSYPTNSMNRDGFGKPKNLFFGNVERNRISSQCLKRTMRQYAVENYPEIHGGIRTRKWEALTKYIEEYYKVKLSEKTVKLIKEIFCSSKEAKDGEVKEGKEIMVFISRDEFYETYKILEKNPKDADALEAFKQSFKNVKDNSEIYMYGRMVACNPSLNVEGCMTVGSAMSTHKARIEFDFFTAVDEMEPDAGSGHLDASMFTSFVAYRYLSINLGMLNKQSDKFDKKTMLKIIRSAIESSIYSFPSGKKTSFPAMSLPSYINIMVREGQPIKHDNAFFVPVKGNNILEDSVTTLKTSMNKTFELYPELVKNVIFNKNLPDLNAKELVNELEKTI